MHNSSLFLLFIGCSDQTVFFADPITNAKDNQTLMHIPGGTYQIGSNLYTHDESPQHPVSLSDFYLGKTEVTNAQFSLFLNENSNEEERQQWIGLRQDLPRGALISFTGTRFRPHYGYEEHPVLGVSYFGAVAYCRWAGLRLPTEEEWEVAARGGNPNATYPWGDESPEGRANYNQKWRDSEKNPPTTPVGLFPENGYGLVDMAGNVQEWTSSRYRPYLIEELPEEIRASLDGKRVVRGGGFNGTEEDLRVSFRRNYVERIRSYYTGGLGFRCAQDTGKKK